MALNIISGERRWIDVGVNNLGLTGIALDANYIFAVCQSNIPTLSIISRKNHKPVAVIQLNELGDPHSITIDAKGYVYIVSTAHDSVSRYFFDKQKNKLKYVDCMWNPKNSLQNSDTHHINSIFVCNRNIFISAFGPREGERWSSANDGYIYNITKGLKEIKKIYHPHSIFVERNIFSKRNDFYYCESSSRSVKKNNKIIVKLDKGYTRGLCLWKNHLFLGTSSGRKRSKSTGLVNNPADSGDLEEDCRVLIYKKKWFSSSYNFVNEYQFNPERNEIYDIIFLNDRK